MSAKKNILILCDWFLPGYLAGGPIQSIATLTKHLGSDINIKIITTDRDFKASTAYDAITPNTWTSFKGREVFYVSPENMNPDFLLNLMQQVDCEVIYLNSLFSKFLTIYPLKWKQKGLLNAKIVLAPRGMLRDGALAVKPVKKQLFLIYAKAFGLFKNIHWQSTSAEETQEIKKRIGEKVELTEISNFPATVDEIVSIEKKPGEIKLCFIARILGIKNLDFAIDVLSQIKATAVTFDVYGPQEDEEYWKLCEEKAKQLPTNISFHYKGSLKSEDVGEAINKSHALFLPTQTENFGHVIVQSLMHGRPVVISNNTPWRDLEKENAGFDIDLHHKADFINAIQKLAALGQTEFDLLSAGSESFINRKLNIENIKEKYLRMFGTIK